MQEQKTFLNKFYSYTHVVPPKTQWYINFLKEQLKCIEDNPLDYSSTPDWIKSLKTEHKNDLLEYISCVNGLDIIKYLNPYENALNELGSFKSFKDKYPSFVIDLKKIVMYDPWKDLSVNFGDFNCTFIPQAVYCRPVGNNNINADGYCHPYIGREQRKYKLCLGEYELGYKESFRSGRFGDAIQIVKTVLTTYGGDELNGNDHGPHVALFMWSGIRCHVCDDIFKFEDSGVNCSQTNKPICKECMSSCRDELLGGYFIPSLLNACTDCDKSSSTVIDGRCSNCRLKEHIENAST